MSAGLADTTIPKRLACLHTAGFGGIGGGRGGGENPEILNPNQASAVFV